MRSFSKIFLGALIGLAVPAAAVHAGDATPVAMSPSDMKWVPSKEAPGVMTAVAWGDPATGPHGAFHKFVAGFTAPLHTHSGNNKIVVIAGTMSVTGEDGKEVKLPAGSFYTQPNTYPHVTKCLAGSECVVYLESDAKWDLKPVEAKKK
jgi:anti-sigma factor ChrR (cupin superfamily)